MQRNEGNCAYCGEWTAYRDENDLCGCPVHLGSRAAKKAAAANERPKGACSEPAYTGLMARVKGLEVRDE